MKSARSSGCAYHESSRVAQVVPTDNLLDRRAARWLKVSAPRVCHRKQYNLRDLFGGPNDRRDLALPKQLQRNALQTLGEIDGARVVASRRSVELMSNGASCEITEPLSPSTIDS
jgi:hypothetical protein